MKRILLFSHLAWANRMSGAEKSIFILSKILNESNFDVKVISPEQGMITRDLSLAGIKTEIVPYNCFWEMMTPDQGFRHRLEMFKKQENGKLVHLYRAIKRYQPEYAVVNTVVNVLAASAAKAMGIRVFWFIREPIEEAPCQKEAAELVVRLSDRIVVNSRAVERMFHSHRVGNKVLYLSNAIDPERLENQNWPQYRQKVRKSLGLGESMVLVGFIGTLGSEKGADEFVYMAAKVGIKAPGTVFCLAGTGTARHLSQLGQLARDAAKDVPVHFLGEWANINTLLPALDVVVLPSTVPEGCPRAALEAMAFGKPLVAFQVGGMEDLVRHSQTGYLAPWKDREALANYVLMLVKDAGIRNEFGREARRVVETNYHVKDYVKRIKRLLDYQ